MVFFYCLQTFQHSRGAATLPRGFLIGSRHKASQHLRPISAAVDKDWLVQTAFSYWEHEGFITTQSTAPHPVIVHH